LAALLDVNALIALVDSDHVSHGVMTRWFRQHHRAGWATCPLTENGMVRILSQASYSSGRRTPAEVVDVLSALKAAFAESHEFWNDDLSLTDTSVFDAAFIAGSRQVTDAYLLGLVMRRSATLASFDRSLPWHAIRGGSEKLIHIPS
jgi:toxin-antitoxin system PIN domain toxin